MLPALFGSSVAQVNLLIDTLLASFLVSGSVSWLYYSDRLVEFPLGIFGVALWTVILPKLSRHHASAEPHDFSHTLDWALRWALLMVFPPQLTLMILGRTNFVGAVSVRRVRRARCANVRPQPDGLCLGLGRLYVDQGAGQRVLRPPGHPALR